ncbi:polypeptide N-acetylgalactosaminyltransferase 5-like [Aplysia californica]|uniref:Polypeptide N-acetylgalactosaminyltransferase 5-like n=1 Tax=Aplysia californica TaxID=6500 RepID=A0ABM1A6R0_APLCA|nr:polypeptide N-acetylgalactosaminyltransferase 5-like [Aplysia californica]
MPHPPSLPAHRVWGMGVKLWLLCVIRKCRTLTTALVFLCLWICLITVINTVSDGGRPTVAISDARNNFLRPDDLSRSAASVLRLSPTNKEWERDSLSLGRNDARSGPRNELRFPPPGGEARWVPGPDARDQDTSAVLENGIIGGRRIQGIKAGEMEGLESLSARSERDEQDGEPSVAAAAGVSTPAQIDTHDTSEMAIAGTARELSQDLGDLRSNWTPKMGQNPPELNIPGQGLKAARQESQQDRFVSSRARNSFLSSLTEPRKPGSEGEETGTGSGTYGLLGRGKSIGKRLSPAGAELHNRQTALYDRGSDQAINTLFNSDEPSTTRENEAGERTRKSQTRFTASSNQYPTSPLANLDKTSRTQTLKDQGRKSNLERGIAMQMDVPKRNTGFSPTATIDQIGEPAARQMWLGVKYPAQTYSFPGVEKDKSNGEGERSAPSLSSHAKARNESTSAVGVSTPRKSSDIGDQQGRAINPAFIKPPVSGALDWLSASGPSNSLLSGPGRDVQQADTSGHKRLKNDGFDLYSYNVTASDWLSLSREIPDTRPPGCPAAAAYNQTGQLRASVVICFHNEALSVLLRTVHSVLGRTPGPLLDRLILVDDFSDTDDLQSELDDRLRDLDPRILLTRTSKREGLVRSRLIGSNLATSEVLVFLDAHCECNTDWLEPLLAQIAQGHDQV